MSQELATESQASDSEETWLQLPKSSDGDRERERERERRERERASVRVRDREERNTREREREIANSLQEPLMAFRAYGCSCSALSFQLY